MRAPLHQWTQMTQYHHINAHVDMVEQRSCGILHCHQTSPPSRRKQLVISTAISITEVAIKDICALLIIIGTYFPCRGLRESEAEIEDTLMQVAEIYSKYIDTHFIIVAADFNADLRSVASRSDKIKRTLFSLSLSLFDCPAQPTFHHHSDIGQSQIDYIIGSPDLDIHIDIHDRWPNGGAQRWATGGPTVACHCWANVGPLAKITLAHRWLPTGWCYLGAGPSCDSSRAIAHCNIQYMWYIVRLDSSVE